MMKLVAGACSVVLTLTTAVSAQTPAGPEFRVNTFTPGSQAVGRPAMEPDGDFVVVWMSAQDGDRYGAFGQRFAASGAPRGSEFRINTYTMGSQRDPAVAVGSGGDFVVVWENVQYLTTESIKGRRFDAAGGAIGAEFVVNTVTTTYKFRPSVGRASDGRFVVGWSSGAAYYGPFWFAARRFAASGNPIGSEFVVSFSSYTSMTGDLAVEANGNFVAVWDSCCDGSGWGIRGQRFDAAANRLGNEFLVNSYMFGHQFLPSVSVSPAGGFVVPWTSEFGDGSARAAFSRRFDASGNAVGNDFVVNTYTTGDQYGISGQVAHDARGNFVATWMSAYQDGSGFGSFAQRFSASGARRGAEFRVNTYTTGSQKAPSVASDAVGNFVVTWNSVYQDGSDSGVFAQRFGGLGPAALTVDSSGNRVLEPGETVDVRPTWRNFNGGAQTFGGKLTNITGPAGPTYTIIDATGNYGAVANGATAQCTDCYAVAVSNPATRPASHWDASAVESIVPDVQGQQKQWVLHVGRSFTDVSTTSPFYESIEILLHNGITAGCTYGARNTYCPAAPVTREAMATFLLLAKEGAGYLPAPCQVPMFADVPASSSFCRWIEELARRGIVAGCGGGNYCPTLSVSREAMAVLVLRTLDPAMNPPDCSPPNIYPDVPETSPFCRWIEEVANRGVFTDCGGGNYCPTAAMTRELMSVFISVTFGLTLYGP
jgi:S-layer family protein